MQKLIWMGLVTVLGISAVETRAWRQTDYSDFEKGSLKRLSLGSDGRLTLAPVVKELLDPSVGYMWACAEDSKGNLYAGGGSTTGTSAKLFVIDKAGKSSVAAELEGMEIHAIAIDSKDTVYAATSPDGKVYRIHKGGKPEVFFDPKSRYIWAMVFGANGDLYVGTGDKGQIFRVSPEGRGSVFFETDESHARSLAVDRGGDLIVGTEPSGLVLRVSAAGKGFVLQQTAKREVTAVAVSKSGVIYAAAVGNRGAAGVGPIASPAAAVPPPPAAAQAATGAIVIKPATTNHSPSLTPVPTMAGGSEVYRIDADGYARRVWSHGSELVYSIAFDSAERPLIATGNRGNVYRLDSLQRYTLLTSLEPTQVTQLVSERSGTGAVFAVTGNIAKVYKIGPEFEHEGVFESDLLDAGAFTYWGRLEHEGRENGGRLKVETRSGNLNDAHKNWSPWAALGAGARVESPAARFIQYKLELTAGSKGTSPDVDAIDLKFQAKNIAPVIEQVEVTPPNYKFPGTVVISTGGAPAVTSPSTLNLPAIGRKRTQIGGAGAAASAAEATPTLSYAKGFTGVRWAASDENGDTLTFRVEIRGVKESAWTVLRDKIREHYLSWDSTAYADGEYIVRITASDSPSNIPEEAKSASLESEPFLVDNAAPEIVGLTASSAGAGKVNVAFRAKDGLSNIVRAEYSINGGDWTEAEPVTRLSDAKELSYKLAVDRGASTGEFTVAVRVADEFDNQTVAKVEGR
ncbi:MAG TPA: hypothetical protein VGL53_29020 [Bryobacteraceae bacterium]